MVEYHALVAYDSAFYIRTVAGKKEYLYRRLSGHTALDTSGRDLICFVTTELGPRWQRVMAV